MCQVRFEFTHGLAHVQLTVVALVLHFATVHKIVKVALVGRRVCWPLVLGASQTCFGWNPQDAMSHISTVFL